MPHVRRIRTLGERERHVVVSHLQETIDQTGWEVHEGVVRGTESCDMSDSQIHVCNSILQSSVVNFGRKIRVIDASEQGPPKTLSSTTDICFALIPHKWKWQKTI